MRWMHGAQGRVFGSAVHAVVEGIHQLADALLTSELLEEAYFVH